jgi:hypothetical protein
MSHIFLAENELFNIQSLEDESPFKKIQYFESENNRSVENKVAWWEQIKQKIVQIANDQYIHTWKSGSLRESNQIMVPIIRKYWSQGVYEGHEVPKYINIPGSAWSSAFISWVVNQAGGGSRFSKVGTELKYRAKFRPAAHWRYVAAAKVNREKKECNPFRAFRVNEVKPELGDIVVRSRNNSKATFETFEARQTHGDIVVEVDKKMIGVIGGNVSNTVSKRKIPLNPFTGFIQSSGGTKNDHFAIVRIVTNIFRLSSCKDIK